MNKAYRTLWSEARQCFVVAHEKAAARGKPSTTRKALVRAVAAALLVLGAAPALATNLCTGGATTISGTTTPPDNCSLGNNASLTVTGTGKLLAGTNTTGVEVYGVTTTGSIINHGTIAAARTGIRVESNSSIGGGITNTGQITSSDKRGIRVESSILAGSIYNSGTITGGTAGILLESETTLGGGITNSGTIQGGSAGIMIFSSTLMGKIVNHGSILTDSTGDAAALFIRSSSVVGGLVNDGTIDGRPKGILLAFSSTLTGGLTNSGTIAGSEYAIYVDSSSLDSIVITGNDTAKFIGEVYAPATPVTVAGGATYTLDNGNHFQVQIFTNQGTLKIGAGSEATISGDFTLANTGTFSPAVADSGYGRISVSGAVALGGTLAVDAAGLTAANTYNGTVAGVIYGGSSRTGTFATVTDNSLLFDFTPVYKTDGFDLTFGGSSPGGVLAAVNATGNSPARGAAAALDAIIADNPGGPIATLFLPFSTQQQVSDAVSQTLP
ncbi:MAG: ESPR-type extended signal peptide-containing protein, partial [Chloroflexaceae bacterium]|nr:ESPR-type extended signal peptide-containing protein [Chloroflexaceae bacterium]